VSERNGVLDIWVHSEARGQTRRYHNPGGSVRYVAAPIPTMGFQLGQRISMCMRGDVIPGYKAAILLWPEEGPGNYWGEIDFPEGRFNTGVDPFAFMHYAPEPRSGRHQDWFASGVLFSEWHVYTIEWNPRATTPYVKFYVDGRLLGTSTRHIPPKRMQLVLQIETWPGGERLPRPAQGHVKFDWITIATPG
jgi:hypothetical protein